MSFEIKFVALTIINFHYFIVKMLKPKKKRKNNLYFYSQRMGFRLLERNKK